MNTYTRLCHQLFQRFVTHSPHLFYDLDPIICIVRQMTSFRGIVYKRNQIMEYWCSDNEDRSRIRFHHYVYKTMMFDREKKPALVHYSMQRTSQLLLLQYHMNEETRFKTAMDSALHVVFVLHTFSLKQSSG